jgi:DNA-binding Lrp family transcriptional regulator
VPAYRELAARIGIAASSCHVRTKMLRDRGVLAGFHAEVDLTTVGLAVQALIAFQVRPLSRQVIQGFQAFALSLPQVRAVYVLTGNDDFLIHVAVPDLPALHGVARHLFPRIDHWRQRMESAPTPPEAGSSLLKDDGPRTRTSSQAVSGQLVSAADHWDALRALLQDAQIVRARAPFTLLRGAIENSATAVWLLAPASRDVRVLRRLRLEWKNFVDQENAEKLLAGVPWTSRADTKAELQRIARARSLTEDMVSQVASNPVAFSMIVRTTATEATHCGLTDIQALYCWMAASGIARAIEHSTGPDSYGASPWGTTGLNRRGRRP